MLKNSKIRLILIREKSSKPFADNIGNFSVDLKHKKNKPMGSLLSLKHILPMSYAV